MKKTVVGAVIALLAAGLFASLVVVKNLNGRIAELESARETAASAISDAPQAAKPAEGEGKAQEAKPAQEAAKPAAAAAKPAASQAADDGKHVRYVVKDGDDICGIAIEFNVSPRQIRMLNGLAEDYQPRAGDVLLLPKDGETGETVATNPKTSAKKAAVPKTDYHEMKVLNFAYDGSRHSSSAGIRHDYCRAHGCPHMRGRRG